jgi:hypothetical protein
MRAPKVKMSMPQLTFCVFLMKFVGTLVSKPRDDQSKTHLTTQRPFPKLAGHPEGCEDVMMSRAGGAEVKMNLAP